MDNPVQGDLLGANDPPPFTLENENGKAPVIILGDHAGRAIPQTLGGLGLHRAALDKHWSYDIGTRDLCLKLSTLLDAPLLLCNYSRLVIDVNRRLDHPTAIPAAFEGHTIKVNAAITPEERESRTKAIYEPYHRRIEAMVNGYLERGIIPALVSIHSFTPVFFKQKRPWEVAVLWAQDSRLPVAVMDYFRAKGFTVGDNEPYDARMLSGATLHKHADSKNLPSLLLEVRNDLIGTRAEAEAMAETVAGCLSPLIGDETLHSYYDGEAHEYDIEREQRYFEDLIKKAQEEEGEEEQ
jgi:predicted N-formylglutamate amidohydrolase